MTYRLKTIRYKVRKRRTRTRESESTPRPAAAPSSACCHPFSIQSLSLTHTITLLLQNSEVRILLQNENGPCPLLGKKNASKNDRRHAVAMLSWSSFCFVYLSRFFLPGSLLPLFFSPYGPFLPLQLLPTLFSFVKPFSFLLTAFATRSLLSKMSPTCLPTKRLPVTKTLPTMSMSYFRTFLPFNTEWT